MATTAPREQPRYDLSDGTSVPQIGFGTYPLSGADGTASIRSALEAGYRLLDTAVNYGNEAEVGRALRDSGVPREEVTVVTKIPGRAHRRDLALRTVEESLQRLGLDRLDLVLTHWPNPSQGRYVEAFGALVEARERGLTRSVGVSNHTEQHLGEIIAATGVVPVVNQVEVHPLFPQPELIEAHERLGIRTMAWSPLGKRQAQYDAGPVQEAARAHGVSPAQVIVRWHLQRGTLPVPKSGDPARQRSNLDVLAFTLTPDEVEAITALGRPDGRLFGGDPEVHEED